MHLNSEPFELIQSGKKTYEFRLYDTKRRTLEIGDEIVFSHIDDPSKTLNVKILKIIIADSFRDLIQVLGESSYSYSSLEFEDFVNSFYKIYTKEKEDEFGACAIKIEVQN